MASIAYGAVCEPKKGNLESGDCYRLEKSGGRILLAVADGLGSGAPAREASQRAVDTAAERMDQPLPRILEACHIALGDTRGAAVGLLRLEPSEQRISYAGVGNIEVRTTRDSGFKPISTNGIVGANYRTPRLTEATYRPGEWIVIHSDGLSTRFDLDEQLRFPGASPQELAQQLVDGYARDGDDITVIAMILP